MGRAVLGLAVVALMVCASSAHGQPARFTVFGDSVLTAVEWNDEPLEILEHGLDVQLDVGVCRTSVGVSCPFDGERVPTLIDRVRELGAGHELAPNVVVEVGYNDDPDTFDSAVEQSLTALREAGAERVWWLDLRETKTQYARMNAVLRAAAARHGELTVVDWNAYSGNQPQWFQADGEHLVYGGAIAIASLIHSALLAPPHAAVGVISVAPLPPATAGRPYSGALRGAGGVGPYAFRVTSGRPPVGLHLRPDGRVSGTPRKHGTTRFTVEVRDALGTRATCTVTARVR